LSLRFRDEEGLEKEGMASCGVRLLGMLLVAKSRNLHRTRTMEDVDVSCSLTTTFSVRCPPLCAPPRPRPQPPSTLVASRPPYWPSFLSARSLRPTLVLSLIHALARKHFRPAISYCRNYNSIHHFLAFGFWVGELQDPGRTFCLQLILFFKLRRPSRC
jgi:hypothetical protein